MMILNLSESLAKPLVMAKLNMAYLSSLNKRAKLLSSYLPVSPSRVLRAPGTSSYHLVPKHLRATWPRPEQSHLLPEACSPDGTDKRRQRQRRTERPPPEPSNILRLSHTPFVFLTLLFCLVYRALGKLVNRNPPSVPIWEHSIPAEITKLRGRITVKTVQMNLVQYHKPALEQSSRLQSFKQALSAAYVITYASTLNELNQFLSITNLTSSYTQKSSHGSAPSLEPPLLQTLYYRRVYEFGVSRHSPPLGFLPYSRPIFLEMVSILTFSVEDLKNRYEVIVWSLWLIFKMKVTPIIFVPVFEAATV